MTAALRTVALGKRYGRQWALRDCTLEVPAGRVAALVGPNGAGKTTLLHLAVGLTAPTAGGVEVFGLAPRARPAEVLPRVGFLAQDQPLYRRFTVADMLTVGRKLNPRWDDALARDRLARLGLPLDRAVGKLSGGQRAQVALALALGKRPDLLLLDEPVAALDPLARREFLQVLMESAAEGLGVVFSSHVIADLERVCDYLIILARGRVQVADEIDRILATHKLLVGPRRDPEAVASVHHVLRCTHTGRETTLLVRTNGPVWDQGWEVHDLSLEEIVLAYLGQPSETQVAARDHEEVSA
ncbi:MAG TPA: ABC transporter ATP-binding protein [Thermomicrobiales bacterium]|nr:ABC transporter ATP-binding protein [Thermomicrobiales bacterium]